MMELDPLVILQAARQQAQAEFSILSQREDWFFITTLMDKVIDHIIGMTSSVEVKHTPVSCECDADCDGDGYFKCSRYCPLHDDCESCGERPGAIKDPDWVRTLTSKRPMWLCLPCAAPEALEQASGGERRTGSAMCDENGRTAEDE